MAVTNTAVFPQGFKHAGAKLTGARTTYDATGVTNAVLVYTANANGAEIVHAGAYPTATSTASQVYLFYTEDSGTTNFLAAIATHAAQTVSATSTVVVTALTHMDGTAISESNPLRLTASMKLYAAETVANTVTLAIQAKDY
jgi:nucleoside-diphosphate-sugar epimerase